MPFCRWDTSECIRSDSDCDESCVVQIAVRANESASTALNSNGLLSTPPPSLTSAVYPTEVEITPGIWLYCAVTLLKSAGPKLELTVVPLKSAPDWKAATVGTLWLCDEINTRANIVKIVASVSRSVMRILCRGARAIWAIANIGAAPRLRVARLEPNC